MDVGAISSFIKQKRKAVPLTQQDIANTLGVTPQAVSKWERGECLPDISLLTELAFLLDVSVEDILNGGAKKSLSLQDVGDALNAFVSTELYEAIKQDFQTAELISDIDSPADVFIFLTNTQKFELLDIILEKSDYINIIDDCMQYFNNSQRQRLTKHILDKKDYGNLDPLMPYLPNFIKSIVVDELLKNSAFDYLEEIITMLGSEQKSNIIKFVLDNNLSTDILENFIMFFDKKQRELILQNFNEEEVK